MPEAKERQLPPGLEILAELAVDLRWTGSLFLNRLWQRLEPEIWERTQNPAILLKYAPRRELERAANDRVLMAELKTWIQRREAYLQRPAWFGKNHGEAPLRQVAYFSMEFMLSEALPIYSGGLGNVAGDQLKSASDLGVPVVGVGLLYQQGYFRQVLGKDGAQLEAFPFNDPGSLPITPLRDETGRWPRIRLELPGRSLFLRAWRARVGRCDLYLLDANDPLNSPWDRGITANLYAAGYEKRFLQEVVLGVGGFRLLETLGLNVQVCHLNEGHAAFATLARAASFAQAHGVTFPVALRATRPGNVFTTHTPVEAAFDRFDPALLSDYVRPFLKSTGMPLRWLLGLGRRDPHDDHEPFNMAYLALRTSGFTNAVSQLHARVSRRLFAGLFPDWPLADVPVSSITNGIHVPTWDSAPANSLWQSANGKNRWTENLEHAAESLKQTSPQQIWNFRAAARKQLVDYVRARLSRQLEENGAPQEAVSRARHTLNPNTLTLGFARRFTAYKRPNLILSDVERFLRILNDAHQPVQFIVAGKAHPNDPHGKAMVQAMAQFAARSDACDRVVFLQDYDMTLAQHLTAGIDVWLNNPVRNNEASGTSGMKILANGGLNLSELDGWWDEAYNEQVGWALGDRRTESGPSWDAAEAAQFYDLLESQIAPEFYERNEAGIPAAWVERIRASMTELTPKFSSDRSLKQYVEQAYLPAAEGFERRSANGAALALELERWGQDLNENWHGVRFAPPRTRQAGERTIVEVHAYLGDLNAANIRVELYADAIDGFERTLIPMALEGPLPGAINAFLFTAMLPDRPADHFTPRIVPYHEHASVPLEERPICWAEPAVEEATS